MPDIDFSLKDAVARLDDECKQAVQRVKGEYQRLVAQLHDTHIARQQVNDGSLQLGASAIGVVELRVFAPHVQSFSLDTHNGYRSETCALLRPLKPGRYRVVVVFTEDEEKTETPK